MHFRYLVLGGGGLGSAGSGLRLQLLGRVPCCDLCKLPRPGQSLGGRHRRTRLQNNVWNAFCDGWVEFDFVLAAVCGCVQRLGCDSRGLPRIKP